MSGHLTAPSQLLSQVACLSYVFVDYLFSWTRMVVAFKIIHLRSLVGRKADKGQY